MAGITGITLAVYAGQEGGAALFLETQNVQLDAAGRFTVLLGATKSQGLPMDIFDSGEARWIGIEPSGQAEQPRILLVSVPYALKAADAETLGGLPVTAFVLAGAPAASNLSTASSAVPNIRQPLLNTLTPAAPCLSPGPTTSGAATTNSIALFTTPCNIESSLLMQSNNTTVQLPATGTATNLGGFSSNALDFQASSFISGINLAVPQDFLWKAEPVGNNTASASGSLNLLFGSNGSVPAETGFSIGSNGLVTFATGQTFPGAQTSLTAGTGISISSNTIGNTGVLSAVAGSGLAVSAGTGNVTFSIQSSGITPSMVSSGNYGINVTGNATTASAAGTAGTATSLAAPPTQCGSNLFSTGITASGNANCTQPGFSQLSGSVGGTQLSGTYSNPLTLTSPLSAAGTVLPVTAAGNSIPSFPLDLQASNSSGVSQTLRLLADGTTPVWDFQSCSGTACAPAATGLSIAGNGLITFKSGQTFPGAQTSLTAGTGISISSNTIGNTGVLSAVAGSGLAVSAGTGNVTFSIPSSGITPSMVSSGNYGINVIGNATTASAAGTATSLAAPPTQCGSNLFSTGITASGNANCTQPGFSQLSGSVGGTQLSGTYSNPLTLTSPLSAAGTVLPVTAAGNSIPSFPLDLQASNSSGVNQTLRLLADGTTPVWDFQSCSGTACTPAATGLSIAGNGLITFKSGQTFPGAQTSLTAGTGISISSNTIGNTGVLSAVAGSGLAVSAGTGNVTFSIPSSGITPSMVSSGNYGINVTGNATTATAAGTAGTATSLAAPPTQCGANLFSTGITAGGNANCTQPGFSQLSGSVGGTQLSGTYSNPLKLTSPLTLTSPLSAAGTVLPVTAAGNSIPSFPLDLQASNSSGVSQTLRLLADGTTPVWDFQSCSGTACTPAATGLTIAGNGLINFKSGQTFPGAQTSLTAGTGISISSNTIGNTGVLSAVAGSGLAVSAGTGNVTFSIPSSGITPSMVSSGNYGINVTGNATTASVASTATSLAAPPTQCGPNLFATGITAGGNANCTQPGFSQLSGSVGGSQLSGTYSNPLTLTSLLTGAGVAMTPLGQATTTQAFNSNPIDLQASTYNTAVSRAATYNFRWQAEPTGNNSNITGATLNLLFGIPIQVSETGVSIDRNGNITAPLFNGNAGQLEGKPVNNAVTPANGQVLAFSTTSGKWEPTTASGGGTITGVTAGTNLTGGGTSGNVTLNLNTAATDARYAQLSAANTFTGNQSVTGTLTATGSVTAPLFSGNAGQLEGKVVNNAVSPTNGQVLAFSTTSDKWEPTTAASGGTITGVTAGTNLTGGGTSGNVTLNLNTAATDARYAQLSAANTFTGNQSVTGTLTATGSVTAPLFNGNAGQLEGKLVDNAVSPTNGQVLAFSTTSGKWEPTTAAAGGGTITGVTAGTDLIGGGTSGNVTLNLNTAGTDARYAQLSAPNTFTGNQLVTGTLTATGSVTAPLFNGNAGAIEGKVVSAATPTDGQVLTYKSTTGQWGPTTTADVLVASSLAKFTPANNSVCSLTICNNSVTEGLFQVYFPRAGTFSNLYARVSNAPGASNSITVTLKTCTPSASTGICAGIAKTLTCTISGATGAGSRNCQDVTGSVSVNAGDFVDWTITTTGTPASTALNIAAEIQ